MRIGALVVLMCLLSLANGCAAGFEGEWLEDGVIGADGKVGSITGVKRLALQFRTPSLVRYGSYVDQMRVVDDSSLQADRFVLFDGWRTAQFGEMIARLEGDYLVASVSGGEQRQFSRVRGHSIFPPQIRLPQVTRSNATMHEMLGYSLG